MATADYTLMTDAVGLPVVLHPDGVEMPNLITRRTVDGGAVGAFQVTWAIKEASVEKGIRIEYSVNGGATWSTLIPDNFSNGEATSQQSAIQGGLPNDFGNAVRALVRAMAVGPSLTIATYTYVVLTTLTDVPMP